jgi:hypothetical protein
MRLGLAQYAAFRLVPAAWDIRRAWRVDPDELSSLNSTAIVSVGSIPHVIEGSGLFQTHPRIGFPAPETSGDRTFLAGLS